MNWISDVIYGLKHDGYGQPMTLIRETSTPNFDFGSKNLISEQLYIPLAIPLPVNLRLQFLRSIGLLKAGALEQGDREVLIDRIDIPDNKKYLLSEGSYFLDAQNRRRYIRRIDDYEDAFIAVVKDQQL